MTQLGEQAPAVVGESERERLLWIGGTIFDVVLSGGQTGGQFALLDQHAKQGDATPMHVHRGEAEAFVLLEGAIVAWAGDDVHEVAAGGCLYLPKDVPHAFRVETPTARLFTVVTPAGFERFVQEAGVPLTGAAPAQWEFDLDRIMAAAPKHRIEILGPPPSAPAPREPAG